MKKIVFVLYIIVVIFAACAQDEVSQPITVAGVEFKFNFDARTITRYNSNDVPVWCRIYRLVDGVEDTEILYDIFAPLSPDETRTENADFEHGWYIRIEVKKARVEWPPWETFTWEGWI